MSGLPCSVGKVFSALNDEGRKRLWAYMHAEPKPSDKAVLLMLEERGFFNVSLQQIGRHRRAPGVECSCKQ